MGGTLLISICFLFSCTCVKDKGLENSLRQAGANRAELEKVLKYYESDSLKLEAAKFLIRNMAFHIGLYDTLFTPKGKEYMPEFISRGHDEAEIRRTFDSLFSCGYYVKGTKKRDIETISSDFLINNIDNAFEVRNKAWVRNIGFDDFCRYILPYRSSNEPLSLLRSEMRRRYLPVLDSANVSTSIEACMLLNGLLKDTLNFVGYLPTYPTVELVDKYKQSNCEGLAFYFVFLLRAVGIPVTIDCTTWAKSEDGHFWCAVMDEHSQWHSFGAAELSCEEHKKWFSQYRNLIPPKVYRCLFAPEALEIDVKDDGYITYVKNPLFKDVTASYYIPPTDIRVKLMEEYENEEKSFVYLCASSINHNRILALGTRMGQKCLVKNVVGDNTFVLAESRDGKTLHFLTDTFYVDKTGRIEGPDVVGYQ